MAQDFTAPVTLEPVKKSADSDKGSPMKAQGFIKKSDSTRSSK
jgi:hypothetical protein